MSITIANRRHISIILAEVAIGGEVAGLPPDVHELTVSATPGAIPIVEVTQLVTVADNKVWDQLIDNLDAKGSD
jgi:hypothetical protein